jgi:hypothetical protein
MLNHNYKKRQLVKFKTEVTKQGWSFSNGLKCLLASTVLLFGLPLAAQAGQTLEVQAGQPLTAQPDKGNVDNPGILPPQSKPYGKSYAEWSAKFWKWAYSLPGTNHPLFDTTGEFVAAGQSGKVWFLGGTYSTTATQLPQGGTQVIGEATRTATIPVGKALFFPILNSQNDNFQVDGNNNQIAPFTYTEQELRQFAAFGFDNGYVRNLVCTIDGRQVNGLQNANTTRYRVQSPLFQYTVPQTDNIYEAQGFHISGAVPPPGAVSDGVYLMVAPLSVGKHTIAFSGDYFVPGDAAANPPTQDFLFSLDIKYNLTVAPPGKH